MALLTIPMVIVDDNADTGSQITATLLALSYIDFEVASGIAVNYYWS